MNKDNNVTSLRGWKMNDNKSDTFRATVFELEAEVNRTNCKSKGKSKPMQAQAIRLSSAMKTRVSTSHFISGIACLAIAFALWTTFWLLPETLGNLNMPAIKLALGVTTIYLVISALGSAWGIVKINQITFKEI